MTDAIKNGSYAIRNLQTGEIRPVKLACDPCDAMIQPDEKLLLREDGHWVEVLQIRVHPLVARLRDIEADIAALVDELEEAL